MDQELKRQISQLKKKQVTSDKIIQNVLERLAAMEQTAIRNVENQKESKEAYEGEIKRSILENNEEIRKLNEKIELLEEEEEQIVQKECTNILKRCSFFNKGYCRSGNECVFYHPEKICHTFKEQGVCPKFNCRDRHPKTCRYWKSGWCERGLSCLYSHNVLNNVAGDETNLKCDRCRNKTAISYFCEFCKMDFCYECTEKEAHKKDLYKENENVGCSDIHKVVEKSDMEDNSETVEMNPIEDNCSKPY